MDGELKIWHWNVNGIRACLNSKKFDEFVIKGKSDQYTILTRKLITSDVARPAILCLNETKIDDGQLEKEGLKL